MASTLRPTIERLSTSDENPLAPVRSKIEPPRKQVSVADLEQNSRHARKNPCEKLTRESKARQAVASDPDPRSDRPRTPVMVIVVVH